MADEECKDLPEECWELIFTFLLRHHHRHFDSLSLVSNLFLSLTNRLRRSLVVSPPTAPLLPSLLRRFRHLKSLDLSQATLFPSLPLIATSGLDLESINLSTHNTLPDTSLLRQLGSAMKNLKTLICSKMGSLDDKDLLLIAVSFPNLQELDISYPEHNYTATSPVFPITDNGLVALSQRLPELRRINLSGNQFVTDLSLLALTAGSCGRLREIELRDCDLVTHKGIDLCLRRFRELDSISATGIGIGIRSSLIESFSFAIGLRTLNLSHSVVSDELLCSIVEACLPLKKLDLSQCQFTYGGIRRVLSKYQSLEHLGLADVNFLTDQRVVQLCEFLSNLTSINLNGCSKLTVQTLVGLTNKCPMLEEIKMERNNLGKEDEAEDDVTGELLAGNSRVRSLFLASNRNLNDPCIKKIASMCPNVEALHLSHCPGVSDGGIAEILKSFGELRHLEMKQCGGIKEVGSGLGDCKLEVLVARRSRVDDKTLAVIGKSCGRLRHLDLEMCMNVTTQGVKEVVRRCRELREVNLRGCGNVSDDVVGWMVFSFSGNSKSLRKIAPPCPNLPTEGERNLYMRHGCLVSHFNS